MLHAIRNHGRLEGDTVTTQSATLNNTATIIGNTVTLNAADISNTGAAAVIAAETRAQLDRNHDEMLKQMAVKRAKEAAAEGKAAKAK